MKRCIRHKWTPWQDMIDGKIPIHNCFVRQCTECLKRQVKTKQGKLILNGFAHDIGK